MKYKLDRMVSNWNLPGKEALEDFNEYQEFFSNFAHSSCHI